MAHPASRHRPGTASAALSRLALVTGLAGLALVASLAAADESLPAPSDSPVSSIASGVYTEAQAARGARVYPVACGKCHGYRLDGAPDDDDMFSTPPIGGRKFLRNWNGRTLAALFEYTRETMPANNPGFLDDQEFADVMAYMIERSGAPAGSEELRPDLSSLALILIEGGS